MASVMFQLFLLGGLLVTSSSGAAENQCLYSDKVGLSQALNMEESLFPYLNLEIPSRGNVYLKDGYASFVLNEQNETLNYGIRSEISIAYPFSEGELLEYKWSFMVPSNTAPGGSENEWWVIAEWVDEKESTVTRWRSFENEPPPVAVFIEKRNGVTGVGVQVAAQGKLNWLPIPTDEWLEVETRILWSTVDNGFVQMEFIGHPELYTLKYAETMANHHQHYFKLGQYRTGSVYEYSVINIKDIKISRVD